jgi:hypothetical protein
MTVTHVLATMVAERVMQRINQDYASYIYAADAVETTDIVHSSKAGSLAHCAAPCVEKPLLSLAATVSMRLHGQTNLAEQFRPFGGPGIR